MDERLSAQIEREPKEPPKDVFDVERLDQERLTALINVLSRASLEASRGLGHSTPEDELYTGLMKDMERLAERSPKKAEEIYDWMIADDDEFLHEIAYDTVTGRAVQHLDDNPTKKQQVIDKWFDDVESDNFDIRDAASTAIARALQGNWFDEATHQYILSRFNELEL